jgi:hypothetical protein
VDVLQLIYEDQIEKLKEKELKEAKKRQRLGDNFLDLLYSIKVKFNHSFEQLLKTNTGSANLLSMIIQSHWPQTWFGHLISMYLVALQINWQFCFFLLDLF